MGKGLGAGATSSSGTGQPSGLGGAWEATVGPGLEAAMTVGRTEAAAASGMSHPAQSVA